MKRCPYSLVNITAVFSEGTIKVYLSCRRVEHATWDKLYIPVEVAADEYKRRYQTTRSRNLDMPAREVEEITLKKWAADLWSVGIQDGETWEPA